MRFYVGFAVLVFGVLSGDLAGAKENFVEFCTNTYVRDSVCPADICKLQCAEGFDGERCPLVCLPVACPAIDIEKCPKDFCAVMTNCSDEKICHYPMMGGQPPCGDLGYAGQDVECCEGFVQRCGIDFIDGNCDMEGKNSVYSLPICIPCGDGVCTNFENHCNCPEDCAKAFMKKNTKKQGKKDDDGDQHKDEKSP